MDKIVVEILIFAVIMYRLYVLNGLNVKSASDKMFALYLLKNHHPLIGYVIIFYIPIVIFLEYMLTSMVDIALLIFFLFELFLKYRHLFTDLQTDKQDVFLSNFIKSTFKSLSQDDYLKIKNELDKEAPVWKLYMNEMMVFLFAVWAIELGVQ